LQLRSLSHFHSLTITDKNTRKDLYCNAINKRLQEIKEDETEENLNERGSFMAQKVSREHLDNALTKTEWRDVFKHISFLQGTGCKVAVQIYNTSRTTYVCSSVLDNKNKFVNTSSWCPFNLAIRRIEEGGHCKFMPVHVFNIFTKNILICFQRINCAAKNP